MEQINLEETIKQLIEKMGFNDFSVTYDSEAKRFSVLITDDRAFQKVLPNFIADFNHLVKMLTKAHGMDPVVVDINNYKKQRQELILELARAAARKAVATKQDISLPPMNAYERRLIHTELAGRPDIKTESIGEDKERAVVVKPI